MTNSDDKIEWPWVTYIIIWLNGDLEGSCHLVQTGSHPNWYKKGWRHARGVTLSCHAVTSSIGAKLSCTSWAGWSRTPSFILPTYKKSVLWGKSGCCAVSSVLKLAVTNNSRPLLGPSLKYLNLKFSPSCIPKYVEIIATKSFIKTFGSQLRFLLCCTTAVNMWNELTNYWLAW